MKKIVQKKNFRHGFAHEEGPPRGPRQRPPGSPEQGPPGGPRRPPWMNSLDLAKSTDGLHFEKLERTVVAHGGVPSLMYDHGKNSIAAIYQYFSFEKEEDFDKIAVSFSNDEGETWTKPQVVTILGLPEPLGNSVDPTIVLLDNGRYRLYFCYPQPRPNTSLLPRIYSAQSEDGLHYKVEDGVRVMVEGKTVNDPAVVKIGDKWHYYSPLFRERGINYHAVSDDGLNFTIVDNIVLEMNMLGCACTVEGGYRFYGTGPKGMTAFSTDGYNWIQEDVRMPGPDPGVVRLKDGTYLMLYTAMKPNRKKLDN